MKRRNIFSLLLAIAMTFTLAINAFAFGETTYVVTITTDDGVTNITGSGLTFSSGTLSGSLANGSYDITIVYADGKELDEANGLTVSDTTGTITVNGANVTGSITTKDSASASSGKTSDTGTTTVTGDLQLPTVDVKVPPTASVVVNPYLMEVEDKSTDTVISTVQVVTNYTDAKLKVEATPTGTSSGITFKETSAAQNEGDSEAEQKEIFLFLQVGAATAADGTGFTAKAVGDYSSSDKTLSLVKTSGSSAAEVVLDAASKTTPNYCAFKLIGNTNSLVKDAWTSEDTVSVSIAFTFTAQPNLPAGAANNGG